MHWIVDLYKGYWTSITVNTRLNSLLPISPQTLVSPHPRTFYFTFFSLIAYWHGQIWNFPQKWRSGAEFPNLGRKCPNMDIRPRPQNFWKLHLNCPPFLKFTYFKKFPEFGQNWKKLTEFSRFSQSFLKNRSFSGFLGFPRVTGPLPGHMQFYCTIYTVIYLNLNLYNAITRFFIKQLSCINKHLLIIVIVIVINIFHPYLQNYIYT